MNRHRLVLSLVLTTLIAWGSVSAALGSGLEPKLGLDLQGGFAVVLTTPEGSLDAGVLDKAVEIMRRRIETLGSVQEPEISVQGDRSILVQLPGVQDRERALEAVGTTGELSFRPVLDRQLGVSPAFLDGTLPPPEGLLGDDPSHDDGTEDTTTTTTTTVAPIPPPNIDPDTGLTIVDDSAAPVAYLLGEDGTVYKLGAAFLTGVDIEGADSGFVGGFGHSGGGGGGWVVDPDFTGTGGDAFERATAQLTQFSPGDPRRSMAIVVDGSVVSAPQVAADLLPGEPLEADGVVITIGTADEPQTEAEDLATILRYGALPTVFERERVETVSASLGSDSLNAGLAAGIGGLILVASAMLIYYRSLGLIAVVGLSVFGSLLVLAIILLGEFQGTTLTLAGVTGIIVSIGITSDSYIVFFERIKEEHRRGRPLRPAVDHAFQRALRTILTADTVTLVGSLLLWVLAIGPVKGFAITLGIATVIDVIVAYFFTRPAAMLLVRSRFGEGGVFSVRGAMGRTAVEAAGAAS
ncbi:MAG: protein translocase subunit SecD [Acidimicrobiia bacterium]